jgi:hypothetical protein
LEKDRVPLFSIANPLTRRATLLLAAAVLSGAAFLTVFAERPHGQPDEQSSDSVGVIDGEAISVTGPMSMDVAGGQVRTVLRSGSDVRVKSGNARIDLVEGGQISICGPAHLSVLKSGASLTVALESGTIHAHIEREPALTIYTAQIQAHTITIGDGPQDVLVGFDSQGAMCLRANRGAVRLEQQLTGQSVIVPQTGDVLLLNGQFENMRSSTGHCTCELQTAKAAPLPPPEISQLATAEEVRRNSLNRKAGDSPAPADQPATEEPVYQVFMPPLIYDAKAKVQPEVDLRMIILVRRVRVRPALIFQGRVQGEIVAAAKPSPPSTRGASASGSKPSVPASDSFVDRVRSFVRKLWSSGN